jgi:hypothetical protein
MALPACDARLKSDPAKRCRKPVVAGRTRCRLHGGLSTGPRTAEGMATGIAAMRAGRARWIEARHQAGLPTFGRRKGATNLSTRRYEAAVAQWQAAAASYDQDRDAHADAVFAATLAKNKHVRVSDIMKYSFAAAERDFSRRTYPPLRPPPQRQDFRGLPKPRRVKRHRPSRATLAPILRATLEPIAQEPLPQAVETCPSSQPAPAGPPGHALGDGWTFDPHTQCWSRVVCQPPPPMPIWKGWP